MSESWIRKFSQVGTEILKKALEESATSIVLFHNHPSGNLKPSKADEQVTQKINNRNVDREERGVPKDISAWWRDIEALWKSGRREAMM